MIVTEAFFKNIKEEILSELDNTKNSVCLAVAWFTDTELAEKLITLHKTKSVLVKVMVVDDKINKTKAIELLTDAGIFIRKVDKKLMHHKFCVLDNNTVITGSYNWTFKASVENDENITIIKGDVEFANEYLKEFSRLTGGKLHEEKTVDISKILKRLKVIEKLIELEETDDIDIQAQRLVNDAEGINIEEIETLLKQKKWSQAIKNIQDFLSKYNTIIIYDDPYIKALQYEIKQLEYDIVAIENSVEEMHGFISRYNNLFIKYCGEILQKILELKREYFRRHRKESKYSQSEYEKAKREYEEHAKEREKEEGNTYYELNSKDKSKLKKLRNEAVLKCHPDKNPGKEIEAAEIFRQVQDAYNHQDINKLQELVFMLNSGWFSVDIKQITDKEILEKKRNALLKKKEKLKDEYNELVIKDEVLVFQKTEKEFVEYFERQKDTLSSELNYWEKLSTSNEEKSPDKE